MNKRLYKLCIVSALSLALSACSASGHPRQNKTLSLSQQHEKWKVFDGNISGQKISSDLVTEYAQSIFNEGNPLGMAIVVIDNNQVIHRSFGETYPGSGVKPNQNSLIRIASLTKLMTSEVMIKLADQKRIKITDPLQKYSYNGVHVPGLGANQPIRLFHLASHTSGLPREQPGGKWGRPVFIWPTQSNRWNWLKTAEVNSVPGTVASYSNLAYDLLADALSNATGEPYSRLLQEEITRPYNMKDTTLAPTRAQCERLMAGANSSPCLSTIAAAGSGGIYSTPADMQRWMQQFLSSDSQLRKQTASREQGIYFKRADLSSVKGMDVAGKADGIGLGWVYMKGQNGIGIYQKTGGGGGFNTYMAMIPEQNIGVFMVMTRKEHSKFYEVTKGVNELVTALAQNHYSVVPELVKNN
ncbi:MAG: D-alanyl-D-alanine-carboxypeptidase/endopeptidase AmpH [Enterobacteriaceae bacterium]|nr:D-alanyl-D-alanine-carboxypeptidase/endopeptidase AmpH [Enterobacteriaceae bacterium]